MTPIEQWRTLVLDGAGSEDDVMRALIERKPTLVTGILERTCNLDCAHCLYPLSESSKRISESADLRRVVLNILNQAPSGSVFLHEGRILQSWHVELFADIQDESPKLPIGLIDNGTYVRHLKLFQEHKVRLNWLDISVDGTEEIHNAQRDPQGKSFGVAMHGIEQAPEVADSISSLMALTSLNCDDVKNTADLLLGSGCVDEMHVSPMIPYLAKNRPIEMSFENCRTAWGQIRESAQRYGERFFFKLYRSDDLRKFAKSIGRKQMRKSLKELWTNGGSVQFRVDEVAVTYFPASLIISEVFIVDADSAYRVSGSQQYSLAELLRGFTHSGENIRKFTFSQLSATSKFTEVYNNAVISWWENFGRRYFEEEKRLFSEIAGGV